MPSKSRLQLLKSLAAKKSLDLPYSEIPGVISKRSLEEHLKLYQGYVDLLARVDKELEALSEKDLPTKHLPDHPFRALKEAETYALGGILLHELYFENLTDKSSDAKGLEVEDFIKQDFGSINEWKSCMRASIMEARAWVIFACDEDGKYRILMLDAHNVGSMFGYHPLAAIDTTEHSRWIDFGADLGAYADAVLEALNWDVINRRYLATKN